MIDPRYHACTLFALIQAMASALYLGRKIFDSTFSLFSDEFVFLIFVLDKTRYEHVVFFETQKFSKPNSRIHRFASFTINTFSPLGHFVSSTTCKSILQESSMIWWMLWRVLPREYSPTCQCTARHRTQLTCRVRTRSKRPETSFIS